MTTLVRSWELWFRHRIVYPALRLVIRNPQVPLPLKEGTFNSVLLIRFDRLGDMIVTSWFCRHLRTLYPSLRIGIVASPRNVAVARIMPGVDDIYVVGGSVARTVAEVMRMRKAQYDVVINFIFNRTTSAGILANCACPGGIKVGQGDPKYGFYFNAMLELERVHVHMAEILRTVGVKVFGERFTTDNLQYELLDAPESRARVGAFNSGTAGPFVVVNCSSGESERDPTTEQVRTAVRHLVNRGYRVVLIAGPDAQPALDAAAASFAPPDVRRYPPEGSAPFADMIALVRDASLLVTPDTSLIHVASAVGCPVVGLYSGFKDVKEWLPRGVRYEVVMSPERGPVSAIATPQIVEAIDRVLSAGNNGGGA